MNLRTIKIFIASSSELKEDRRELELTILRKNDILKDKGVYLDVVVWENFLDQVSATRLQDEYNKSILDCDFFIMMFFTKVGKFTFEEFNVAHENFKQTGRPKIYTYFKDAPLNTGKINEEDIVSMLDFKKKLKEIGHYVTNYENIDNLKYHFSEQLNKHESTSSIDIKIDGTPTIQPEAQKYVAESKSKFSKSVKYIIPLLLILILLIWQPWSSFSEVEIIPKELKLENNSEINNGIDGQPEVSLASEQDPSSEHKILGYKIIKRTQNRLDVEVEYFFAGNGDNQVDLGINTEKYENFSFYPIDVKSGTHKALVKLLVSSEAPDSFSTEELQFTMYDNELEKYIHKQTTPFPNNWRR